MSVGFGIGDFIATAQLAHRLYNGLYLVARGAPEELQLLNNEIGNLALSIDLLVEELKNDHSTLTKYLVEQNRRNMMNDVLKQSNATLKDLELFSQKYDFGISDGKKSKGKRIWDRLRWANDLKSVDGLRAKIARHNGTINLLLTSAGNSSLERVEKTNNQMLNDIDKIQDMINALPVLNPMLSAIEEKRSQIILSQAFMKEAEKTRPWTATSFDDWLAAGRWWLLKAQTQLYAESSSLTIPPQAYADLLKASFILVDIFPNHPLRRFWISEYFQVELLAEELKRELARSESLRLRKPATNTVENADLRIWADNPPEIDLTPAPYVESCSRGPGSWQTQDEQILWRGFASLTRPDRDDFEECVVLVLKPKDLECSRIVCQNQKGSSVFSCRLDFINVDSMPLQFDHHVWRRFNVPISRSTQNTTLRVKDHKVILLNLDDMLELSSVLRAIILDTFLAISQTSFLAVMAAWLSQCPVAFQRQLSLHRQFDTEDKASKGPPIVQEMVQAILIRMESIDVQEIEKYTDCSFYDGPDMHEHPALSRIVADWIYQIVRVCSRMDTTLVAYFEHVFLDETEWFLLENPPDDGGGQDPTVTPSFADIARGIAIDFGDTELLAALCWNPRTYDGTSVRFVCYYWDLPNFDLEEVEVLTYAQRRISLFSPSKHAEPRFNLSGAVNMGYSAIVKATLKSIDSCTLNLYDLDYLLYLAAIRGFTDIVQSLLDLGSEFFNDSDLSFYSYSLALDESNLRPAVPTALNLAAIRGNIDSCRLLMQYRASWHGTRPRKVSALHFAARYGHTQLVAFLLESGEEIDAKDLKGKTPLHQALKRGHKETAAMLLNHGASITVAYSLRQGYGASAFDLALNGSKEGKLAAMILSHAKRSNAVISVARWTMDAIYGLHTDKEQWSSWMWPTLRAAGFDANPQIVDGETEMTLLRWAIRHGRLAYVDILPRLGACIDQETRTEYRRVLQILGWKPADFRKSVLPQIQLDTMEIERRVKRYSGLKIQKRSFYPTKYIKDGEPSKDLQILVSKPEFWLVEPNDEDVVSLSAEEEEFLGGLFDKKIPNEMIADENTTPVNASKPIGPTTEKPACPSTHTAGTCSLKNSPEDEGRSASMPIRFNIMFVKDD